MYSGLLWENTNWFELDPSWIKHMAFDFVISEHVLVSINIVGHNEHTFYKQFH